MIQTEQVIFRTVFVYPYMHTMTIHGKRGCELEGECGGEYGRVWREQREGRNAVIQV